MARPINEKEVKARIKDNKAAMRSHKKYISDQLNQCMKGGGIDKSGVRATVSAFIKAAEAVQKDTAKL